MAKKTTKPNLSVDITDVITETVEAAPKKAAEAPVINQTVVQTINPALAKQQADNDRIKKLNNDFMRKIKSEPKVAYKPPKYYGEILSPIYVFTLNNLDVVVRFDGTTQYFPETVYKFLMKKLARILDGNTPQEKITEL